MAKTPAEKMSDYRRRKRETFNELKTHIEGMINNAEKLQKLTQDECDYRSFDAREHNARLRAQLEFALEALKRVS